MRNKQIAVGIAAAAAAIVIAAGIISKRRKNSSNFEFDAVRARDQFKGKLNNLQRKAQKEYRETIGDNEEIANAAKDRVNQWVNQSQH